jgi:hypothetical protein
MLILLLLLLLLQVPADLDKATFTALLPQSCDLATADAKTWGKVVPRVLAQRFATLRLSVDKKKVSMCCCAACYTAAAAAAGLCSCLSSCSALPRSA